ncbi:hypothetical protein FSARC_12401 [Fusarium sarcochroum]|uniref:Trichothecene efflux pump n=1 Tax=Fusarium sarcochroum TaxID=1208366 RepID=A0A8H4T8L4_9HYPO|nr:hypothetical protein FSARC_12401 [Fusarium sarcochroum]
MAQGTHRYQTIQIAGLCVKITGIGILLDGRKATDNTVALVISMVLIGLGGSMSVVGSRVASEASVPHQDVALVISLLSLWSRIGSAIGSAVVSVIWPNKMPGELREHLPASANETDLQTLFSSVTKIRTLYEFDNPMRQGAITAYRNSLWYCLVVALGLAYINLFAAFFQTNYFLGKQQNAVTNVGNDGLPLEEENRNLEPLPPSKDKKEAFLRFWAGGQ